MSTLVLRDAEVEGSRVDVRVEGGLVTGVGPPGHEPAAGSAGRRGADVVIDCAGGALLPGLHDHHLHLLSMAAAAESVDLSDGHAHSHGPSHAHAPAHGHSRGEPAGRSGSRPGDPSGGMDDAIRAAHAHAAPGAAIRVVGYDDVRHGPLDRRHLDALAPARSVRVQHRSGALWVLSSVALEEVEAAESPHHGIERDHLGQPTGRLFRLDGWLRGRLPDRALPDLGAVGRRLASYGVTGVTDCTPAGATAYFEPLAAAVRTGALPLTVWVTGGPDLSESDPPAPLRRGPVKVLITDHEFPALTHVCQEFGRAHRAGRAVAVHCVSRAGLLLALAAWHEVGSIQGDRVEHASVTPPEAVTALRELGLTVVTQPAFLSARGDQYLAEVEPADRPDLYRCASLQDAGVPVGGSTDAPFGPDDPWVAVRAAVERRAASGTLVGSDRGLAPAAALDLFLGSPEHPGGPRRRVAAGAPADLCLLDVPLRTALLEPSHRHVATTIAGGERTYTA
jgi:predicted amidohydrolase YtcJ